jgi:DNA-binding NtrC family response regulator
MARLLIVDDEPLILKALARALRRRGFDVVTALDGRHALELLEKHAPDAVISDFRMPGMSGEALLAEVKERAPGTRRFLLTGFAPAQTASGEEPALLCKPWDEDELAATLRAALPRCPVSPPEPSVGGPRRARSPCEDPEGG